MDSLVNSTSTDPFSTNASYPDHPPHKNLTFDGTFSFSLSMSAIVACAFGTVTSSTTSRL